MKAIINEAQKLGKTETENRKELIDIFISRSKYHQKNWDDYKKGNNKLNWAPFLLGGFWFLFKGMLLFGLLYIFFVLAIIVMLSDTFDIFLKSIFTTINGLIIYKGNTLYYNFINKKIDKIMLTVDDQSTRIKKLKKIKIRNTIIGVFISFILIIWGMLYTSHIEQLDQYLQDFDRLEIAKYQNKVNNDFNELLDHSSDYSDAIALSILNKQIIPNQKEVIDRMSQLRSSERIMIVHREGVETQKIKLEAFKTISNGIMQKNSEIVQLGLKNLEESSHKASSFERKFASLFDLYRQFGNSIRY